MNDETITELPPPPPPFELVNPTPLQLQMLETAAEMGLDVEWYKEHILSDPNCLNGLALVTE